MRSKQETALDCLSQLIEISYQEDQKNPDVCQYGPNLAYGPVTYRLMALRDLLKEIFQEKTEVVVIGGPHA